MKAFIVNSHIAPAQLDSLAWIQGIAKMLSDANIENVKLKNAYCCTPDKKMIGEFHAVDKQALTAALNKIEFPFSEITEVTAAI
jgi:hypothetical protein